MVLCDVTVRVRVRVRGRSYEECEWGRTIKGCSHRDWAATQPMIYSCEGLRRDPVDFIFMNGALDPSTNVSGLVIKPTQEHKHDPEYYTTSFPPMTFGIDRLREVSGCTPGGERELTFRNGTAGNRTRCHSYVGRKSSLSNQESARGH